MDQSRLRFASVADATTAAASDAVLAPTGSAAGEIFRW